jgi:phosphoglycolate phosphatase-like HAD superfamily hydrolase
MRVFLFDIDGTLIDAGGAGRRSMTAAFAGVFGIDQPFEAFDLLGRTDLNIVWEVCQRHLGRRPGDEELARFFDAYLARLELELRRGDGYRVLPGTREIVEHLAGRPDVVLGLGTGNLEAGARLKLARTGYAHHFRVGGFGADGPDRAAVLRRGVERARALVPGAAVDPKDVWIVGDSVRDVEAARAIGATAVAIAAGWQSLEVLRAAGPDLAFSSMLDLYGLVNEGYDGAGSGERS